MKRALVLALTLIMCLGLWACGSKETPPVNTPTTPVTNGAEKLKDPVTEESLAGTYRSRLWFLDHTVTLNADGTYNFVTGEKGTFTLDDKYITLYSEDGLSTRNFMAGNRCIYSFEAWYFDADEDSGITLSVDENGFTDQSFEAHIPDGSIPGSDYNRISLDLNEDGSFALTLRRNDGSATSVTYEGTYISKNATLLLTYDRQDYPLILNNANYVFLLIYDKVQ